MDLRIYEYKNCGTCKKALKYLENKGIKYKTIPIRDNPPTPAELKKMLKHVNGELKKLFNTSGQDYRNLGMKDKINTLDKSEAIELLAKNGNLIKRPFVLGNGVGIVGFKEDLWNELFNQH